MVRAGLPPTIVSVNDIRPRFAGTVGARPDEQPLDDWLGDISDEDWSENAAERAGRRRGAPASQELPGPEGDDSRDSTADRPARARPFAAAEAHDAVIQRRRLVAGLAIVVVLGLAVGISVLLLRGGGQSPVTPAPTATPPPGETGPSSAPTTPSTTPSTATPTTTPSTRGGSTSNFTLPEGTKLRLGEGDPALIRELQQALSRAGYDPGPVDGTFGPRTQAAVVAFQQANGLSADGVVGPETASTLDTAVAGG
jgi:hypothetical protein